MIELQDITYTYPNASTAALQDVSLCVFPGEFLLLCGPSGSGKSTLLRCLNGLVPHFSGGTLAGRVVVNGLDVVAQGPRALSKHVGFVQQDPEAQAVLDHVEPEVAFALENTAVSPQTMRVRVEEVLDLLGLNDLRARALSTLSGGERQRVAIASALALRPGILVLDEPTSQLDPQSAEDVLHALVRLNEDLGLTIVLAEHRLERVLRYADRLVYLDNGRICVDGPVREAAVRLPQLPPLARLGRVLDWQPLPLTVKEGRRFAGGAWSTVAGNGQRAGRTVETAVTALSVRNLSFDYDGKPVLGGVSLEVQPGEAVALMGRNGSGKSTLLKCIIGLLRAKRGEVWVNGRDTRGRDVAEVAREVAYLPQNPDDLLFAETVSDELNITLRNHDLLQLNGVQDLLRELGLASVAGAYPRDLSVGQRQRVALGAVTITQPRLLLLDEPTRGLDGDTKEDLVAIWRRWLAQGMSLLLVTHDVELAATIADRVVVLSQGEVLAEGTATDILGASPLFAPQIAKLFPGRGWLTVEDALDGLSKAA